MNLSPELTYDYTFNDAYLFYCKSHDCVRVSEDHRDSVTLNGITQTNLNEFIENYFKFVLDNDELVEFFKNTLADIKLAEANKIVYPKDND